MPPPCAHMSQQFYAAPVGAQRSVPGIENRRRNVSGEIIRLYLMRLYMMCAHRSPQGAATRHPYEARMD